jgi:hypothetical protein
MNYVAMRKNCVRQARLQFKSILRDIDKMNTKRTIRFVDFPLPMIINSGCCQHNILYTLACGKCRRKEMECSTK